VELAVAVDELLAHYHFGHHTVASDLDGLATQQTEEGRLPVGDALDKSAASVEGSGFMDMAPARG
jgi:hypothetical protein